jgi:ABC-type lipoprotein release transport system permease subunit/ABC-type Zn uptake system ZnuABC Zn-binding protein ZnuA
MNLPFYIARRYLFARKSHNAINIISMISVCGVAVATVAMVCVLSVFNGFGALVASMFSHFDPELKVTAVAGKVFDPGTAEVMRMRGMPEIDVCTATLEDNVLVRYGDRQEVAVAKGVEESFRQMVDVDTLLIDGSFVLQEGETAYAVAGVGLAYALGVQAGFVDPLEILAPRRDERVNMANPVASFRAEYAFVGGVFCINQPSYDEKYVILPIATVRELLHYDTEVSALELKLVPGADVRAVRKRIGALLGDGFSVTDRYGQQEASYRMMQVEKWMSFLILAFVLTIALFNVVGSLYMLMIEKQDDVKMLRCMGADNRLIKRIFMTEGAMIPAIGAAIGAVVGVALCMVQQRFGIVKLGNTMGAFVSDNYPVQIEIIDIILIFMTILLIGLTAAWFPVGRLGGKWQKGTRLVAWLFPLLLCGCGEQQRPEPSISVTIEPQRYFAERIAGDHFAVNTVVPVGQSPETYDPAPHEMIRIAQSRAYLQIGRIGFEQAWMGAIRDNNPKVAFFDLSLGINWIENDADGHAHFGDPAHDHLDPHIWTSPRNARVMAMNTLMAVISIDPANELEYSYNWQRLVATIDSTEHILRAMLDTLTHRSFVIYHPALTYFADDFDLEQLAIEADGKEPSAASMRALVDRARAEDVRVVFVQQEFDRKHAEQLAATIGARVVAINPLDSRWDEQMIFIARALCGQAPEPKHE